jgi:hypothetical protein
VHAIKAYRASGGTTPHRSIEIHLSLRDFGLSPGCEVFALRRCYAALIDR